MQAQVITKTQHQAIFGFEVDSGDAVETFHQSFKVENNTSHGQRLEI